MILRRNTLPLLIAGALLPLASHAQDGARETAVQLAPVAVQGVKADEGYTRSDASGATKTDTPIIETPQAISVISNTQMTDQGVLTVQDALRYSAGVRADAYGVDSRG